MPAIGADPKGSTWERETNALGYEHRRLEQVLHAKLHSAAQVHLYDHLEEAERSLELRPSNDPSHKQSAEDLAAAEGRVAEFGISEWTDRFVHALHKHRKRHKTLQRPIFFISHSTGGIVVKGAMSRKPFEGHQDISAICLGVTFFATPHHGSSVLFEPQYVKAVQSKLGLKWEMSDRLRQDFLLRNDGLKNLNYDFAVSVSGVKVWSYVEANDTELTVLSTDSSGAESETIIKLCIVDGRSGKLGSSDVPIEDEQLLRLHTTHIGVPRFVREEELYFDYIDEITHLVKNFSVEERLAYHALNTSIMMGTQVDIHQFYVVGSQEESESMKILSASPSLKTFLDIGPTKCMEQRIRGNHEISPPIDNALLQAPVEVSLGKNSVEPPIMPKYSTTPMELRMPTVTVTTADEDGAVRDVSTNQSMLKASAATITPIKNTPKPPAGNKDLDNPGSPNHLRPKAPSKQNNPIGDPSSKDAVQTKDADKARRPLRKYLFPLPNSSSDRFKWIHVPFTHAGWVPHVLKTISHEKRNLALHSKLLLDKMWFSEHNNARHAAPHARFVRPGVKCLLPRDVEHSHVDNITNPFSATSDVQFIVYLPYLHWDSFKNLKQRAGIIHKRRQQPHARPVDKEVASGKSMEHKLIWQHLSSAWPVHCRRTLDQYGYPTLRNTTVRDGDQILYKRTKPRPDLETIQTKDATKKHENQKRSLRRTLTGRLPIAANEDDDGVLLAPTLTGVDDGAAKVLMVDQLWLWIMDKETVITFFGSKEKEDMDKGLRGEGNLRSEIYRDVNGDYANQCRDPFDFAALAVYHAIKAMLDRAIDRDLQVFGVFEEYISILTERQTSSFKQFRNVHGLEGAEDTSDEHHIDNRTDLDALLELRDIEDELKTIRKLIKEQQTCVSNMLERYKMLHTQPGKEGLGVNGINFLIEVELFLTENDERVQVMKENARSAQDGFKDLLDMKQKQATIVEALLARKQMHLTHKQTEAAVKQSRVAMEQSRVILIFTVITIIFLPLSFFASVFGINSREWSGSQSYLSLRKIFTYMFTISLAIITFALSVAFYRYLQKIFANTWSFVGPALKPPLRRLRLIQNPSRSIPGETALGPLLDVEKATHPNGNPIFSNVPKSYTARLGLGDDELWLRQPSDVGCKKA